jgi:iron complex transport system permease protein
MASDTVAATGSAGLERVEGDRSARARGVTVVLALAMVCAMAYGVSAGASDASALGVLKAWMLGGEVEARDLIIVKDIRLPRVLLGALVGAALAVSGAVMQGLFRNPLADPAIVGVSSGAALGAVCTIVLGTTVLAPLVAVLGIYTLPLSAFAGGLAVTLVLYAIATRRGRTSIATMLLAGIALGAIATAITGLLVFMADDRQLRDLTFWSLGSLAGATWTKIMAAGPIIACVLLCAPFLARGLNALALGEAAATHIGVPVQRFKSVAIVAVAAGTGAAVAVSGGIAFVGIVVPHLLRLAVGPDNRWLLPSSAFLGAALLILADVFARTVVVPAELPIGIVTAAAGGPVFLWILLRRRGIVDF